MNERLLPNLTDEQCRILYSKSLELRSFRQSYRELTKKQKNLNDEFVKLSVHHEFRSPWAISKPNKDSVIEKVFARNTPQTDSLFLNTDQIVQNYIQNLFNSRENLILQFASDERVAAKKMICELHSCKMSLDEFISTFVIPPFYGHFLGIENMDAFIESVGIVFDCYSHDPIPFLATFDGSFICNVLRQFFFSPLIRPYVGEQFTVFYDFFSSNKRATDGQQYTRIQRFFSLFLKEMAAPISVSPPFIRKLFSRISQNFDDKTKVIMAVVIYCIVSDLVIYPIAYSVFPLTSNTKIETAEHIQTMKFYCAFVCGLPQSHTIGKMTPVQEIEQVDRQLIQNLVDVLLSPVSEQEIIPEIPTVVIPFIALKFLAKFEENKEVLTALNVSTKNSVKDSSKESYRDSMRLDNSKDGVKDGYPKAPETIIKFIVKNENNITKDKEFRRIVELFASRHPDTFFAISPRLKAIQMYFKNKSINYEIFSSQVDESIANAKDNLLSSQTKIDVLERSIKLTNNAITASEAIFANNIVNGILNDTNISNEIEKKKAQMLNDPIMFANFITSHLDAFQAKNHWADSLMRMVARRFHAQVMRTLPVTVFASTKNQLILTDQKFLIQKLKFLESLEENGLDDSVAKIVKCKDILAAAQTAVLRACLFENPLESAKQIVLGLFVVEDLFIFEFGAPPEANQLMPLLANLFISSPVPNPLSFGEWLAHFLQKLMETRPEWFSDEEMRPLEHYFQFNLWMKDMLLSFDGSKQKDGF
ncbi:hypothetical protein TRFO_07031 [Tritrichomonas foetus]|uniref:Uncharacterized protein n=1 Tax=Tritrichomonas foetus TaxID=1144522 RepID=A0A1J4JW00_9EUKA|nr:hypothetical protein TRFO_07031 [Tritrichomonas foetus]|eukprot:OHT02616.1 hypothetical protein TRFO_07031 [Tritrichomonas foetus]